MMNFLRYLLFPFAVIYLLITKIRNLLFDYQLIKSKSFSIPVIVVGNLSVGGTGKTPQIEYLIQLLREKYKVAVLSRGYKRKTKGFLLLDDTHNAADVGDEPLQYFKKFSEIAVAVDENRAEGISLLQKYKSPEVVLLDDAFQHRKVKGSFYVLLTKYNDLFLDDFILPVGNLRESRAGAKRADVIIVTKCPVNLSVEAQNRIKNRFAKYQKEVFFTTIDYSETIHGEKTKTLEELTNFDILLVTGIANSKPLEVFLSNKNIRYHHLKFSDHHHFSDSDITTIQRNFETIQSDNKLILTTEKDFVRLESKLNNLYYLPIKTAFLDKNEHVKFDDIIQTHLKNFK